MPSDSKLIRTPILDPGKEDKRRWEDKRAGRENVVRAAAVVFCSYCDKPIGPDVLIIDRSSAPRACTECGKKPQSELDLLLSRKVRRP